MKKQPKIGQGISIAKIVAKCLMVFALLSCEKESQDEHLSNFPSEVQQELRNFLTEGKNRGVKLDIRKIHHIYLMSGPSLITIDGNGQSAIGYYSHSEKSIYLDTTSYEFKDMKEAMIFHELGHGLLKRDHKNIHLPNGDLSSIMSGYGLPDFTYSNSFKRQYYLDELFHQNTPCPSWAK